MADDQRQEILECRLGGEFVLKDEIVPQNLRKIFARENEIGAADQSSQEAIQLFQVHRTFDCKAFKNRAQAIAFFISQWLWLHGASLLCSSVPYKAR